MRVTKKNIFTYLFTIIFLLFAILFLRYSISESPIHITKNLAELMMMEEGNAGRIYIQQDNDIYTAKLDSASSPQDAVDAEDDAWCNMTNWPFKLVSDHDYQGMGIIKRSVKGDRLVIKTSDYINVYECIYGCNGTKKGNQLFNNSGKDITDDEISKGVDLVTYTCLDEEGKNIRIVFWREINV